MGDRRRRGAAIAARAGVGLLIVATTVISTGTAAHALTTTASLTPGQATRGTTRTLTWSVTDSAPGNPLECQTPDPLTGAASAAFPCTDGQVLSVTLDPAAPDGSYSAVVTDLTTTESVTDTYQLDAQAADPTFTTTPPTPTNASSLTWSWSSSEPTVECMLAAPGSDGFSWTSCPGGSIVVVPTAAGGGTYTLSVRGVNGAGVASPGISDSVVLDLTAADPTFATTPPSPTNASSLNWTWTSSEPTVECMLVSPVTTEAFAWTACPGGTITVTAAGTGFYRLSVRGVDGFGNVSPGVTSSVERDVTGPVITGLTVSPGTVSHTSNPVATFSGLSAGDVATCRVEDTSATTVAGPVVGCVSPWTVPSGSLPQGNYLVVVTAVDSLNNPGTPASAGFSVDLTGPTTAPVLTGTPGVTGNDETPTWTFTVGAGETARCEFTSSVSGVVSPWAPCGTSSGTNSVTLSSLLGRPEVTYTVHIQAIDSLGNLGAEVTSDYLYDVTPPGLPTVTPSSAAGQSRSFTATWSGTEAADCTVTNSAGTAVLGPTPCSSGATFTVPASEDVYTLSVTLTDAAGNPSTPGTASYRYDITAPGLPGVSGPSQGNSTTPAFALTATESGEVLWCTWTLPAATPSGTPTVYGPSVCSGSSYRPSPALSGDGPWTLSVVGADLAGNTSAPAVRLYNLDTGPPPAPVVSLGTGLTSPGNDLTPTWEFTAESGATTECELRIGSTVLSAWSPCTGGVATYNLTPVDPTVLPDGVYTLWVRATDAFDNTGAPGSAAYTLDTVPPASPTWSAQPTGPSATPASWQFSTGVDGAQCQLAYAGAVVDPWTACSSPWTPALGADGDYALSVRAVDTAGNVGPLVTSVAFVLDTTGPATPLLTQSPATPAPDPAPVVGFSIDASAVAADCRIAKGGAAVVDWAPCGSPWVADLSGQPDGFFDLEIRAVDQAGNVSPSLVVAYDLDSSAPTAVGFITGPTGPARGRTPAYQFPVAPGSSAQCQVTNGAGTLISWTSCAPPCPATAVTTCPASYALNLTGLPDREYRLYVRLVDSAGNPSADKYTSYLLDTTPPAAPVFGLLPPSPSSASITDWRWTAEVGAAAQCQVTAGTRTVLGWRSCSSPFRVNLAGQPDGTYTLSVRVVDRAGNVSRTRTASVVRDTTAPVVTFLSTPSTPTTSRSLRWVWTTEAGATAACLLTRGPVVVADWKPCSGAYTANLNGQPYGTYRLSVRPVDRAGNMGQVTASAVTLVPRVTPPGGQGAGVPPPITRPPVVTPPGGQPPTGPVVRPPAVGPVEQPPTVTPRQPTSRHPVPSGGSLVPPAPVSRIPDLLGRAAVRSFDRPQIPVIILVLIVAFLLIQNRIDRRDPKLAEAPLGAEPTLGFGPLRGLT